MALGTSATGRGASVAGAVAAVVLVGLTLRGPVSSVGPLVGDLRTVLGLSGAAIATLTALPLLCFGAVSASAPLLAGRLGLHRAVLAGTAVLAAGLAMRAAGPIGLFVGTALVGSGIAVGNVLLPASVKADFGPRAAPVTGVLTACMALSASAGAGLAQPLRGLTGGPLTSLALWVVPAVVALLAWLPRARASEPPIDPPPRRAGPGILRDRVAVAVTVFFGLQSLVFYTMLAWLPQILRDAGVAPAAAGAMVAVAALLGVPVSLAVPGLAARRPDQRAWVVLVAVPNALGVVGLLVAPSGAPWVWTLLLGLGTGASFPLALTVILLRSRDAAQTARLSAAAQSVGYLLAAVGPLAVGILHGAVGGWRAPLALLLALIVAQLLAGLPAGRPRLVTG